MGYSVQCVFISRRCCCAETSEGGGGRNRVGLTGCGGVWELDGSALAGCIANSDEAGRREEGSSISGSESETSSMRA